MESIVTLLGVFAIAITDLVGRWLRRLSGLVAIVTVLAASVIAFAVVRFLVFVDELSNSFR